MLLRAWAQPRAHRCQDKRGIGAAPSCTAARWRGPQHGSPRSVLARNKIGDDLLDFVTGEVVGV